MPINESWKAGSVVQRAVKALDGERVFLRRISAGELLGCIGGGGDDANKGMRVVAASVADGEGKPMLNVDDVRGMRADLYMELLELVQAVNGLSAEAEGKGKNPSTPASASA
jgi:hypothetical protein